MNLRIKQSRVLYCILLILKAFIKIRKNVYYQYEKNKKKQKNQEQPEITFRV